MLIDLEMSLLYLTSSVNFSDNKIWDLSKWNYLFIFKAKTFQIQSSNKITPIFSCHYSRILEKENTISIFYNKNSITIKKYKQINWISLIWLTQNSLRREKEKDLKNRLVKEIESNSDLDLLWSEYPTDYWPVDILYYKRSTKEYIVLELKNRKIHERDIKQCERYLEYFQEIFSKEKKVLGIVLWTDISQKVRKYWREKGICTETYLTYNL